MWVSPIGHVIRNRIGVMYEYVIRHIDVLLELCLPTHAHRFPWQQLQALVKAAGD